MAICKPWGASLNDAERISLYAVTDGIAKTDADAGLIATEFVGVLVHVHEQVCEVLGGGSLPSEASARKATERRAMQEGTAVAADWLQSDMDDG